MVFSDRLWVIQRLFNPEWEVMLCNKWAKIYSLAPHMFWYGLSCGCCRCWQLWRCWLWYCTQDPEHVIIVKLHLCWCLWCKVHLRKYGTVFNVLLFLLVCVRACVHVCVHYRNRCSFLGRHFHRLVVPSLLLYSHDGDHWGWEVVAFHTQLLTSWVNHPGTHSALLFAIFVSVNTLMHSK